MTTPQPDQGELINRYLANRDPELRDELITRHAALVHYTLGRLGLSKDMGEDYQDLFSQGLLGLIDAVERYDPAFGTQFSTYAAVRIRGRALDYLRSMDWLSRTARSRSRVVQKAIEQLWTTNREAPSNEQIAEFTGLDLDKVQEALVDSTRALVSLDSMMETDSEEDGNSYYDVLADEHQQDPADLVEEEDSRNDLARRIGELPEREKLVLSLYYYEELTFKEIGQVMSLTESRVCQIHARAVYLLKASMRPHDEHASRNSRSVRSEQQKPENNPPAIRKVNYV